MKDEAIIIPVKKKDLGLISKKSVIIGISIGITLAAAIGAAVIYTHSKGNNL